MEEWKGLDFGWREAFYNSWEAFKINTIPIGCVIKNENNEIVASGRNMIYSKESNNMKLFDNKLAHAEINTILLLNESLHKNIRKYTLYTTMEPCILCFGAIVIGNIRFVKYAARDRSAGATSLNEIHEYTKSKKINIEGPFDQLEYIQICLQSYFELKNSHEKTERILSLFEEVCKNGVSIARKLYKNKTLENFSEKNKDIEYVFNILMENM
jgi:tRNA(adenine34) deaminase